MELTAPLHWRCVDFISDLHLQASENETFKAWASYMESTAADAVFILGDLFEVWVGDDVLADAHSFEVQCAEVMARASLKRSVYVMHGNRDFLMGPALMQRAKATLLDDTTVLVFADRRWLLAHGDAQCLGDTAYQQFRTQVRSAQWQTDFLGKPLPERQALARSIRQKSESIKRENPSFADVDTAAASELLEAHNSHCLVHGHTHRPGRHPLGANTERVVLSDWDLAANPPRADVLRIQSPVAGQPRLQRISPVTAATLAR
jgi:UDP-2,3-diacylglucosamine hydrolase